MNTLHSTHTHTLHTHICRNVCFISVSVWGGGGVSCSVRAEAESRKGTAKYISRLLCFAVHKGLCHCNSNNNVMIHCTALHYTTLHCTTLHYTALHRATLQASGKLYGLHALSFSYSCSPTDNGLTKQPPPPFPSSLHYSSSPLA